MSDELKEIEKKLEELIDKSYGRFENIEKAFNLGIQSANLLNKLEITDYKFKCLEDKRNEENKKEKFNEAIDKINKFLLKIIQRSAKETIRERGNWGIEKMDYMRSTYVEKFSEETASKFNIQFVRADMQSYGGDFDLYFEILGELKELLQKYDIQGELKATLDNNDGEESTTLYEEEDVRYIRSVYLGTLQRLRDKEIEEIEEINNEIQKLYTFKILSTNI
jgi:hypothetical protein